mmetsp:Transcript_13123/g.40290  ORF Transcript_13123/g.40290 Transcript_13123/m.40290 type:complete len:87 (-) Transcript_13123:422-682(-)
MVLLARCCSYRVAKHRLQEARDAQNLHEITDLLLDETPRDTRERLKPTQNQSSRSRASLPPRNRDRSQAAARRGVGARREGPHRDV